MISFVELYIQLLFLIQSNTKSTEIMNTRGFIAEIPKDLWRRTVEVGGIQFVQLKCRQLTGRPGPYARISCVRLSECLLPAFIGGGGWKLYAIVVVACESQKLVMKPARFRHDYVPGHLLYAGVSQCIL
jgi:hypothetical protein